MKQTVTAYYGEGSGDIIAAASPKVVFTFTTAGLNENLPAKIAGGAVIPWRFVVPFAGLYKVSFHTGLSPLVFPQDIEAGSVTIETRPPTSAAYLTDSLTDFTVLSTLAFPAGTRAASDVNRIIMYRSAFFFSAGTEIVLFLNYTRTVTTGVIAYATETAVSVIYLTESVEQV